MSDESSCDSYQSKAWVDFYEKAWEFRMRYLKELKDRGITHPLSLIRHIYSMEKRNILSCGTGEATYIKRAFTGYEMAPDGYPCFRISSLRGEYIHVPYHIITTQLVDFLFYYIENNGPFDAIVELGCGYGRNIFELYYNGAPRNIDYYGGELTSSGVAMANILSSLDVNINMKFFTFDHTLPCLDIVNGYKRILYFTAHSIEQVHHISPTYFRAVAGSAQDVTCVHFEPFGFQLDKLGEATEQQRILFENNGWNADLALALHQASADGVIDLKFVGTELFLSNDPSNPTSLAVWTSRQCSR